MTCQHPYCPHPVQSVCTNHCHWSLCAQHINEHQKCLITEFEQVLEDLTKPTNELLKSIEQKKQHIVEDQQKDHGRLKRFHQTKIDKLEQQLTQINQLQKQYNQISEHIIKIKNNETVLTQNDFQHINNLSRDINQYHNPLPDMTIVQTQVEPIYCPLTSLNIYGLSASHDVTLCQSRRKIRYLFEHFRKYHHLTEHYANVLVNAVINNSDRKQTIVFPSDAKITDVHDKHPCPLNNTPAESGFLYTPCSSMVSDKFLPMHLKTVHCLRVPQIKEIIDAHRHHE